MLALRVGVSPQLDDSALGRQQTLGPGGQNFGLMLLLLQRRVLGSAAAERRQHRRRRRLGGLVDDLDLLGGSRGR